MSTRVCGPVCAEGMGYQMSSGMAVGQMMVWRGKRARPMLLPLLPLLMLSGCHPTGNYELMLPNNYVLSACSANDASIRPQRVFTLSEPHVDAKVVEAGWDERFILAKQHPLRSIGDPVVGNGGISQYVAVDHAVTNYWILDTAIPKVYGPFSKNEYLRQREVLSVPSHIVMQRTWLLRGK